MGRKRTVSVVNIILTADDENSSAALCPERIFLKKLFRIYFLSNCYSQKLSDLLLIPNHTIIRAEIKAPA